MQQQKQQKASCRTPQVPHKVDKEHLAVAAVPAAVGVRLRGTFAVIGRCRNMNFIEYHI